MIRRSSTEISTQVEDDVCYTRPGDAEVYGTDAVTGDPTCAMVWLASPHGRTRGRVLWITSFTLRVIDNAEIGNSLKEDCYYALTLQG